ncbi:MAG: hypothetical protein AAFW95_01235 [Cyanobacteria bacterium J06638_6]
MLYTAGTSGDAMGAARLAQTNDTLTASAVVATEDGLFLEDAEITLAPPEGEITIDV